MKIKEVRFDRHILVCTNVKDDESKPCCGRRAGLEIYQKLKQRVKEGNFEGRVKVSQARCFSMCTEGPNMVVYPEQIWHTGVTVDDVGEIIKKYIDPFEKRA